MLWQDADRGAKGRRVDVYVRCGREVRPGVGFIELYRVVFKLRARARVGKKLKEYLRYKCRLKLHPPLRTSARPMIFFATYAPGTHLPSLGL